MVEGEGEAREQIVKVKEGRDNLHRVNPSALLARLVAARRRLLVREEDITHIDGIIAMDRSMLYIVIATLDVQVVVGADFLRKLLNNWGILCNVRRTLVVTQLKAFAQEFALYRIQPFLTTFIYAGDEFVRAAKALEARRDDVAASLLRTALASFELRQLRTDLERTVWQISNAVHVHGKLDLQRIMQELETAIVRLKQIDCSRMRGFSQQGANDGLLAAQAFFSQTVGQQEALRKGYAQLRQAVSAI